MDAIQDDRILELLSLRPIKILTPTLETIFKGFATEYTANLEKQVEKSAESILNKHCEKLNQNMMSLAEENNQLKLRVEDPERQSKQDNLVIHGLKEPSGSDLQLDGSDASKNPLQRSHSSIQSVVDLCNDKLVIKIVASDMS